MGIFTEQYLAAIGRQNVRKMCSTSELSDSTVLEYPGVKFVDDGKAPGNNMHYWVSVWFEYFQSLPFGLFDLKDLQPD